MAQENDLLHHQQNQVRQVHVTHLELIQPESHLQGWQREAKECNKS